MSLSSETETNSNELLDPCQWEISRFVIPMAQTTFGQRLKQAFNNASNVEIARKIGVSGPAVQNYMSGRVPDLDKLLKIKALTNCDLDWLLTGNESLAGHAIERVLSGKILDRLRSIAREQTQHVYRSAEIVSEAKADEMTMDLLVKVLVDEGLQAFGLAEDSLLDESARVDAERLTFIHHRPTIDDRIRDLVKRETGVSPLAQGGELRHIIRDIVQEEMKVRVFPIELKTEQEARRKKTG